MHGRFAGIALAVAASLALPGAAGAATKTVQVGPYGERQAAFQKVFGDANAYFRKTVTIHKGDKVRWSINGFHSVTFVPANGQPTLRPNPLAVAPQGGKTFSPNSLRNSGLPLAEGPPPPYTLRFKRKGTFRYLCVVHPGMTGKVKVVGADRSIPSAGDDRRAARRQQKAALQQVQRLTTGLGTEDLEKTIQAGNDRRSGATVFRFFPANPSYKVGDTVTLRMPAVSSEAHTFTFGPTNGKDAYNDQLAAGLLGEVFDPRGAYPSEPPPAGVPSITTAQHGNGFFNSGVLDQDSASPQPASTKVTFGAPGTYQLICLIHPFMTNTV